MDQFCEITMGGLIRDTASRYPDHDALVFPARSLKLSYAQFEQKVKALELQVVAFQNRTQMAVRALEKSTDQAMAELMNAILSITGEIAAEVGANLVLPKQQVVLHEPRMDVTAQVIERLNAKLPSVNFPVPQVEQAPTAAEPPPTKPGRK